MYTLKKSLGQHFLKDENISRKIVDALRTFEFKNLLEVGPGGGALTKYLLRIPGVNFTCVEIDEEKVKWLIQNFPELDGHIIHKDFLTIAIPFKDDFVVVGNFPYNISSQILFRVIEWKEHVVGVIGMFQKEVAERVAAKEGNKVYGVTSVLVQAFFSVHYLFEVSETSFQPPPKVKSAVLRLVPLKAKISMQSERSLFLLVKTAFNQRRKKLRNSVRNLFEEKFLEDPIFDKRAEQLSVQDFASLTFHMKQD